MIAHLVVEGSESATEAQSLYRWLTDDSEVTTRVGLALKSQSNLPGEMGPGLDLIEALFNGAIDLSTLLLAVANWRETRHHVSIRVKSGDASIEINEANQVDAQKAVKSFIDSVSED
ncbi:hypothetical protein OG229_13970 [Streptomyces platensis]|uniref:effector-associated constant component EACC1 n=1 Tax=Streptomyces platensis TaxID=58346 RepID=UPI002E15D879|nr:hypothetical protein OG229_13970 [Streptomyces platensis]